ncbi:hypothetical protein SteCoe_18710 [Stentor coeruleus]|uniref:Tr-type G domain-containing protein n=1 Tax=Stentor coeruleus TaxID=5963 RepID=A0A1R2BW35_9CILI|nr:hypothetical protein SteCoe_18710 [Stentor coeruleus]
MSGGGLNPNAAAFEWNTDAFEFVPSEPSPPQQFYTPKIYPASYSYNPQSEVKCILTAEAYFYYWNDGKVYLKDGHGQIFGPFNEMDNTMFYNTFYLQSAEEEQPPVKDDGHISFSDFMKSQETRSKTSGPKIGFKEVVVAGVEKTQVVEEEAQVEEIKPQMKIREKPKVKLVVEKPIDKQALICKLRENPEPNQENRTIEPDSKLTPVNIVFIGHVDAGKSTICGNILLLTNKIDKRLIETYEQEAKEKGRESWWLAYIMDQNEEERAKGKTVEVGRAFFETQSKRFTILDAPGHKAYVPNMINGASQAEYAALVISARISEFETGFERGGQTREHAMLAKSFGVTKLIVVINKMDDPSVNWSQERYEQIKKDMSPYLAESCKYNIEKDVEWVAISGINGDNILNKVSAEKAPWYTGSTLFEIFDRLPTPIRSPEEPLRIPIIDRVKDQGLTIYGKVESGLAVKGLRILIMPIKIKGEIVEIIGGEDTKLMYANPGENVKMRIKVPEEVDVQRGYVICDVHSVCHITNEFKADVQFLELPDPKMLITAGYNCVMHLHTDIQECEVTEVIALFDAEKKRKVKTAFCKSGQRVLLKIKTVNEVCIEKYTSLVQLGRFVLRDKGVTVGLGKIIEFTDQLEVEDQVTN